MKDKDVIVVGKHDDIITPLTQGKKVQCLECKEGIYRSPYCDPKHAYWFVCDKCGGHVHFDPIIEI